MEQVTGLCDAQAQFDLVATSAQDYLGKGSFDGARVYTTLRHAIDGHRDARASHHPSASRSSA